MNKINILLLAFLLLLISLLSCFNNSIDRFRDISWGTNINTFKKNEFICENTSSYVQGLKSYTRENERLNYYNIKVSKIKYLFLNDKFVAVSIVVQGKQNCSNIKNTLEDKFGKPEQKLVFKDSVNMTEWNVKQISIQLHERDDEAELMFFYNKLLKNIVSGTDANVKNL